MHRLGNLLRGIKAWKNAGNPVLKEPSLSLMVSSPACSPPRILPKFQEIGLRLTVGKALRKKCKAEYERADRPFFRAARDASAGRRASRAARRIGRRESRCQGLSGPASSAPASTRTVASAPMDLSSRSAHAAAKSKIRGRRGRSNMWRRLTHKSPKTKSPRISPRASRSGCSVACAKERTRTSTGVTPLEPESSASANSATLANRLRRRSRELPDVWPPVKAGRVQLFS